ncbi:RNA ligase, DRB0094 family [Thozetella sp. PMI_491]|nr:RNA ligase, DRB0094 family [Thozetella sp. PMI_491]
MPRKLVTVRRVAAKGLIQGADRLEVVTVDGWNCVVPIGEFRLEDLAVFFEIDSFLSSSDPRWEPLKSNFRNYHNGHGMRVKTTKIRGIVSQGLLMPLSKFPEIMSVFERLQETEETQLKAVEKLMEMSFADVLGVTKWEPSAEELRTTPTLGPFPRFIPRTDQERVQNLPGVFEEHADTVFQESTKMDGSSMTVYFVRRDSPFYETALQPLNPTGGQTGDRKTGLFGVCSRNVELVERSHESSGAWFWEVALANDIPVKLETWDWSIAIQGEICGSSIQKNFEGFPSGVHEFFVFTCWNIDRQQRLTPRETEEVAKHLGLKHVPVVGYSRLKDLGSNLEDLLERADGTGINGKRREGIVLKEEGGGFSFKVISNSYLLKHGE